LGENRSSFLGPSDRLFFFLQSILVPRVMGI
jgi:hypothetical protein